MDRDGRQSQPRRGRLNDSRAYRGANRRLKARCSCRKGDAHLIAESLDVGLGQLFAVHQALDPTVECGDRGGLVLDGRHVGGCPSDVLHVGVHDVRCRCRWGALRSRDGGRRRREEMTLRSRPGRVAIRSVGQQRSRERGRQRATPPRGRRGSWAMEAAASQPVQIELEDA